MWTLFSSFGKRLFWAVTSLLVLLCRCHVFCSFFWFCVLRRCLSFSLRFTNDFCLGFESSQTSGVCVTLHGYSLALPLLHCAGGRVHRTRAFSTFALVTGVPSVLTRVAQSLWNLLILHVVPKKPSSPFSTSVSTRYPCPESPSEGSHILS